MKICSRCGAEKILEAFARDSRKPSGRASECLECKRIRQNSRVLTETQKQSHRDAARKYHDQNRTDVLPKIRARSAALRNEGDWNQRYWGSPKWKARQALRNAVHSGKVIRPDRCNDCGQTPAEPLHGHHADYSKPLDVDWLCRVCHGRVHRKEAAQV